MMGADGGKDGEKPRHRVTIARPFAVAKHEVTFEEWEACVGSGDCRGIIGDKQRLGEGRQPVVNVSWHDARAYVAWLSRKAGKTYRLLSEAEWEYAARAGAPDDDVGGNSLRGRDLARCTLCGSATDPNRHNIRTLPVGSFPPNAFGLHDMLGNASEWVEDCYNPNYEGAPDDGTARRSGDCQTHIQRGGAYNDLPRDLRAAARAHVARDRTFTFAIGFRVARPE
jgi:formylglycine-generating enzyme required for sulfatase activity